MSWRAFNRALLDGMSPTEPFGEDDGTRRERRHQAEGINKHDVSPYRPRLLIHVIIRWQT